MDMPRFYALLVGNSNNNYHKSLVPEDCSYQVDLSTIDPTTH